MPYHNMPESMWGKMDKCVSDVQGKGKDKQSAIAICYTSLMENKELDTAMKEFELKTPADDAELTDAELWTIDRLYLDVRAGKVALTPLDETETGKANIPGGGTPGGGSPGGGSSSRTSGKHEKCYMHLKKLGLDDGEARRVCRVALGGPELKAAAIETDASLTVHKQADGHYRWVAFTSSSYKDRDGEIISQKALEADTAQMDAASDYGWGDWWHTPIRLASCDFSAMHGRLSIESGIFDDDYIGEKMAALAPELAMSRAFYHPANEPDADGVYHHIRTFRRAFLPRGKESNLLTMLYVSKEEKEMLKDKVNDLKKKLGGTKEAETKVDALLAVADETDKAAADAGLAFKEAAVPPAPVAPPAPPEPPKAAEAKPIAEQPGMFVADMKPEEFDAHLKEATAKAVAELLTPVLAEVKAQIAAIGEAQQAATKEANTGIVAQFKAITEAQAALDKRLGELEGLTPRGYRPTKDKETIITKEQADALKPKPDEKQPKNLSAWIAEPVEQSPVPQ